MVDHHLLQTEVLVAGGGMAGVCAAIAAARQGAQVVLLQDRPMLGGNSSSEVRMHIVGADFHGEQAGWRETGLIEELRLEDAVLNPQRSASMWDILLYDYITREPNIRLMLNTTLDGAIMAERGRIGAVTASRPSTEDRFTIEALMFIDCTGDGRLGVEAGAEYRMGREGRSEFQERDAPEHPDAKTLGSTILFCARDHGHPMPFQAPSWARRFTEGDLAYRPHVPYDFGFWWAEWGGELNTIKDAEAIRDELLRIALGIWDHIKNGGDHGAENWALEWIGILPGKRESRRFIGDYILTQNDLEQATIFPDRVAYGGWPLDTHPPEGIYSPEPPCIHRTLKEPYSIPLRSLYSRNIQNMFMAGRNISATHMAFSSARVMATCAVMGQAAGTAAALCVQRRLTPRELAHDHIMDLQQILLKNDCTILHMTNHDPQDLARRARVSASSARPNNPAHSVIDGHLRSDFKEKDTHIWISAEGAPLPQWLQLDVAHPAPINEIRLTFDTDLFRELTLTQSDHRNRNIRRGPQPETVRDYRVDLLCEGEWRPVVDVHGNHQRHCVHSIPTVVTKAIRIIITATNGAPEARLFEVRLYGPGG